jgi:hypothetical protein
MEGCYAQDPDIIHAWLGELQMEEYARLFVEAGYDLPTVTRMTPEDLTAVGIKKPNHRKRLKAELAHLNVPDNLPDYIPVLFIYVSVPPNTPYIIIISLLMSPLLGHRPTLCITHKENGPYRGSRAD